MRARLAIAAAAALTGLSAAAAPGAVPAAAPPSTDARAAIVVDQRDGHVVYQANTDERLAIASTTKLMTALITLERLPLERPLPAADYKPASSAESLANLRPGERMKVADLLRALLLESANDAAVTLARGVAGSQQRFVKLMNRRARALKLRGTHYENPIGLDDPDNYSTAHDLVRLTRRLMRSEFFALTVRMKTARLLSGAYPRTIENRNDLVGKYPWITGVKTGHTERAGYVLVGSATRDQTKLVSVVLDTPSEGARDADTIALLDYGFSLYRHVTPVRTASPLARASVAWYGDRKVDLVGATNVVLSVRRDQRVRTRLQAPTEVDGPLARGARVGTIAVLVDGRRVRSLPLVTASSVPGANIFRKTAKTVLRWQVIVAVAIVVVAIYWRRRRRRAALAAARRRRRQAAGL